jgi:hypothetical protein
MRSIFVSQLAARVTDRELGIFFESQAGKVRDARVIVDRITRRSKGHVSPFPLSFFSSSFLPSCTSY